MTTTARDVLLAREIASEHLTRNLTNAFAASAQPREHFHFVGTALERTAEDLRMEHRASVAIGDETRTEAIEAVLAELGALIPLVEKAYIADQDKRRTPEG